MVRKIMNTKLQQIGVFRYIHKRNPGIIQDTIDLAALIDSTLSLTENCQNIATMLGIGQIYECDELSSKYAIIQNQYYGDMKCL